LTISSELRDEDDAGLRGGEAEFVGIFDPRHWAAWDGTVTVVIVFTVFVFWRAMFKRLALLELCVSCVPEDESVATAWFQLESLLRGSCYTNFGFEVLFTAVAMLFVFIVDRHLREA
jgi:hypothetical protein